MIEMINFSGLPVSLVSIAAVASILAIFSLFLRRRNNEKTSEILAYLAIGGLGWIIGALTNITEDQIRDSSIPYSVVYPEIVELELGYKDIKLKDFEGILNDQQRRILKEKYAPYDSIFLEKDFVFEFNKLAINSGFVRPVLSRRYSGEEFYELIEPSLTIYGRLEIWHETVERWMNLLKKIEKEQKYDKKRNNIIDFVSNEIHLFVQTTGIVNITVGGMVRGDVEYSEDMFSCTNESTGLVKWQGSSGEYYGIGFSRWQIPVKYHFGRAGKDASTKIATGLATIIDGGCTKNILDFFSLSHEILEKEMKTIDATITKINNFYKVAVPRNLRVTSIVLNPGRFGAAVSSEAVLRFADDALSALKLDMAREEGGNTIVAVGSREVREISFYAEFPENLSEKYVSAFRSDTVDTYLEISVVNHKKLTVFQSGVKDFSE